MAEYCLRWNKHKPNLVAVFAELLKSEALVDVTLAADGHFIHAHKLVLSASSAYFRELFGSTQCKHPIVILKDIRIEDLNTVIDFIYKGEVNVSQERLKDVLQTAELLKIKGLTDNPISFDEHASQGHQHSFGSQRSSLIDSRDLPASFETDEVEEDDSSSPSKKKRRLMGDSAHTSSDSGRDVSPDPETQSRSTEGGGTGNEHLRPLQPTLSDDGEKGYGELQLSPLVEVKKELIKEEHDLNQSHDSESEIQENRAADAMLMLQGSSSDTGEEGAGGSGTDLSCRPLSTGSGGVGGASLSGSEGSSIIPHTQGRCKRAVLQRQTGFIRETAVEDIREETLSPELSMPDIPAPASDAKLTALSREGLLMLSSSSLTSPVASPLATSGTKLLQVPAVVVRQSESLPSASQAQNTKQFLSQPLLVVPSSAGPVHITKQISQPEGSRTVSAGSTGPPSITKHHSQPSVLSHSLSVPLERSSSISQSASGSGGKVQTQQHVPLMQLVVKQEPLGALQQGHLPQVPQLRPIQPKPPPGEDLVKKELPLIQLTPSEDPPTTSAQLLSYFPPRLPRAVSEEPAMKRTQDLQSELLVPGPSPLVQSISQDSALDSTPRPRQLSNSDIQSYFVQKLTSSTNIRHCPVLREGPALGCNYCWNSQDPHGRVQRRKTKYHCPECRTNLCIVPCFHEYHNQIQREQDQHKQITKMLTKTGSM